MIEWRKSSFSPNGGNCVEVAWPAATAAVRDSKNVDGPVIDFPRSAWSRFLSTAK